MDVTQTGFYALGLLASLCVKADVSAVGKFTE